MTAVAYKLPYVPTDRQPLTLVPALSQTPAHVFRRRRIVAAMLASVVIFSLSAGVTQAVTWAWDQATSSSPAPEAVVTPMVNASAHTWTVRSGDTLWGIVTATHPGADPRPVVSEMSKARHGAPLKLGEQIVVP